MKIKDAKIIKKFGRVVSKSGNHFLPQKEIAEIKQSERLANAIIKRNKWPKTALKFFDGFEKFYFAKPEKS